jgi:hypothetical protein
MLDSSLPLDVWTTIVGVLEAADLCGSLTTNKQIHSTSDQDIFCEHFAKLKFPLHLLDISSCENSSWKKSVQDDDAKNGQCRLELNAASFQINQRFCVNMI